MDWLASLLAQCSHEWQRVEALLREKDAMLERQAELLDQCEKNLRKQAQELERQLIASGRLVSVGELTASMAHEFNNPLGIILGFAQERLSDIDPSDPSYRTLQIINEEASRCEVVVRDLLEFARPRSTECVRTDIKAVVQKTLDLLSSRLNKQNVKLTTSVATDLPDIDADAQQLQQVLLHLCSNALDAMSENGLLAVSAKLYSPEKMSLVVADNGFGIDTEHLGKIFQPFFSAKKRRGLGLGLAICDRIIKAHGGRIDVESTPSEGTTFAVYLPLKKAAQREPLPS
jgi:two-component system NtrC family sensor kinase